MVDEYCTGQTVESVCMPYDTKHGWVENCTGGQIADLDIRFKADARAKNI